MKELSIEEKAKRYDEVVARLRHAFNSNRCTLGFMNEVLRYPKESEDERIRRILIEAVTQVLQDQYCSNRGVSKEKVVAWLEKQGTSYTKRDVDNAYVEGMAFAKKELEKRGEQPKEATYTREVETGNGNIKALVTEKVQLPKFKVGNWYQCTKDFFGKGVTFDKNTAYYCAKEGCLQNEYGCHIAIVKDLYDNFKLWTIQDVKGGDILTYNNGAVEIILLFKEWKNGYIGAAHTYAHVFNNNININNWCDCGENAHPATKEQRDILFQKMHEAGYTFDFEKKELKKIEDEEYNGEDYGIDSLYHAQRILEKTLGSVDGYQTDDGILSHKCAITAVKKLYEQKSVDWSKEDEVMIANILDDLFCYQTKVRDEDHQLAEDIEKEINWLKSLRQRYAWKPSDEQMEALYEETQKSDRIRDERIVSLYNDLDKLMKE